MPASTPQNANQIKDVRDRTLSCGWVAHSESWYYTGRTCRSDPLIMPWFEMSEVADKFISMANGFIETLGLDKMDSATGRTEAFPVGQTQ
jgi:hypothetical protein